MIYKNYRYKKYAQTIPGRIFFVRTGIVWVFLCFHLNVLAQTILIDPNAEGGFENGNSFADNGWIAISDNPNYWTIGTATKFSGTNGAYVTNNGSSYQYKSESWGRGCESSSHFYRDITIPPDEGLIKLSFYLKGTGEQGYDRLLIYTAPTSVTPVAGIPEQWTENFPGATLVYTQTAELSDYSRVTLTLPSSLAGTTFRIIFTWQNDDNTTYGKPASIDNICLTSQYGQKFTANQTFTLPDCVSQLTIECWGSGGGGGINSSSGGHHGGNNGSHGGGGGGYAKHIVDNPDTGPYSIIIGNGGEGGKNYGNSNGEDGEASSVSYAGTIIAKGDYGRGSNNTTGGEGGTDNSGNTTTSEGGSGGNGGSQWSYGGGGGAAGPDGKGENGEDATQFKQGGDGGDGDNGLGGFGGTGDTDKDNNDGNNGSDDTNGGGGGGGGTTLNWSGTNNGGNGGYPGGAGGAGERYGGDGADGQVIFSWTQTKTEAICKDTTVYLDDAGNAIVTPEMIDNGSTGNCGIDTMWTEPDTLSCIGESTPVYHSKTLHSENNSFSVKVYITNIRVKKSASWGNVSFNFNIIFDYKFEFLGNTAPEKASNFTLKFSCSPNDIYTYDGIATSTSGTASFYAGGMSNVSQEYYDNFTFESLKCTGITITLINAYNKNGEKLSVTNVELQTSNTQQVSLIVQDPAGNKDTCSSWITVLDTILPQITCPPDIIDTVDANQDSVSNIDLGTPAAFDNCSIIDTVNNAPLKYPADDTTLVSWVVTDASGNTDSCEQKVIIIRERTFDVTISDSTTSCNQASEVPDYNGNDTTTEISFTVDTLGVSWNRYWEFTFTLSSATGATLTNVATSAGSISGTNPYVVTNITAGASIVITLDVTGSAFTEQIVTMNITAAKELTKNTPAIGQANWQAESIVNPIPGTSNITAN